MEFYEGGTGRAESFLHRCERKRAGKEDLEISADPAPVAWLAWNLADFLLWKWGRDCWGDKLICQQDPACLQQAEMVMAEVTQPSLNVSTSQAGTRPSVKQLCACSAHSLAEGSQPWYGEQQTALGSRDYNKLNPSLLSTPELPQKKKEAGRPLQCLTEGPSLITLLLGLDWASERAETTDKAQHSPALLRPSWPRSS